MSLEAPAQLLPPVRKPTRRIKGRTAAQEPTQLRWAFWIISAGLLVFIVFRGLGQSPEVTLGATLIIASALLPTYLWVSQITVGLPLFPLYALTSIWIYGLPLVSEHPSLALFPASFQFTAALSLAGFHLLGTLVWCLVVRRPSGPATRCWMFDERNKDRLFIAALAATTITTIAIGAGWINPGISIFSIMRAVLLASEALICFVLSYRLGRGMLTTPMRLVFFALLGATLVCDLTSLLLINVMSLLGLSLVSYTLAAHNLPWRLCLASLLVLAFLHDGKGAMREKYWQENEFATITPWQYPGFLAEWAAMSWRVIRNGDEDEAPESLAQRASLMHILLYFQAMTPDTLPYLYGESYKAVPVQFVPRILYPDKPRSHEGTYILSVYYNFQTREDTDVTTLDIGLINESYANFGFAGMAALAVVLGCFFGWTSWWARDMPVFSFRNLFAVTVLASILQAGSSASFYVASLYQNLAVLSVGTLLVMRPRQIHRVRGRV